jgi:hypothetical protein
MNINVERFLALTAMLAAPLISASGCVITSGDDDDTNGTSNSNSNTNPGTEESGNETSNTAPSTSAESGTGDTTAADSGSGDTTAADSGSGDTTAADSGSSDGTTGAELGNCCDVDHGMGCDVAEVNDCVCDEDPACCESDWDAICVGEVNSLGCGTCELPPMAWDCYCDAECDGEITDVPWQVCGGDDAEAATNAMGACEADLGRVCDQHTCADCICSTAEIAEIEC